MALRASANGSEQPKRFTVDYIRYLGLSGLYKSVLGESAKGQKPPCPASSAKTGEHERLPHFSYALGTVVLNLLEKSPLLKVFQNLFGRARILGCAMSCRGP
mgnify:CR=1 FL=1